jgi:four helix bundle protein
MPHNPQRLLVVQRAESLVVAIHAYASRHRRALGDLSPGLRNQLVRAATSIALNLGEACGYGSSAKTATLLEVAIGSCNEVERIIRLCTRLGVHDNTTETIIAETCGVRAMTCGFRRRVCGLPPAPTRPPKSDTRPDSDLR